MNDDTTTVSELRLLIERFIAARGWHLSDNAKNVVMALNVEAAELAEIFMWLHSDEVYERIRNDAGAYEHLREEIADVFWYLCRLCAIYGIDLSKAVADKEVKNAVKYPAK
jgi:NTP pyrophosphatase (non-canonical NTP hydrolase)